ncbi:hypothetical protein TNCV_4970271 [Trichonephila clavipes]|nr:hypothetical protein TNCV_4970271 [Trichonephila clavipes]
MLWGGKLLVESILRQTRTPLIRSLTEEWDKLPQQLLDNVVQRMVRRVNVASHSTVDISRTDTFLLRCLLTFICIVPFLRTQIK